jgi:hypothetical protein
MNIKIANGQLLWPKKDSSEYKLEVSLYAHYLLFYRHDLDACVLVPQFMIIHCEIPEGLV